VLRDPRDTEKTVKELDELRSRAARAVQTWANRVSLPSERSTDILSALEDSFTAVIQVVDEFADTSAKEAARDTERDIVLAALERTLHGKVGAPLGDEAHAKAVVEGLRRVDAREPPGYMDKKKEDEGAAGDFLVWEQVLLEAESRNCDVLFVTGDVKEDWWRRESGENRGPRIELVTEMRDRCDKRLFMLRPTGLLSLARELLEVTVRDESVADADRVDRLLSEPEPELPTGGWDLKSIDALLDRLAVESPVRESVIRRAAMQDGFVSREQVYEMGNYPADRTLRAFTRPVNRIAQLFRDAGDIPQSAVDVLWAVYNEDSPNINMAAGFRIHAAVLPLLEPDSDDG
jgi:hypothetical protein